MKKIRVYLDRLLQPASLLALLLLLAFCRYVLQWPLPRVFLLIPIFAIACVGTATQLLATFAVCIPLYTSMQYIFTLSLIMIAYVVRFPKSFRLNICILPAVLMILWESLHLIGADGVTLKSFVGNFVPLGFCGFILCCDTRRIHYPYIVRALAVAVVAVCSFLLLKVLLSDGVAGFEAFMKLRYRLGEESRDVAIEGMDFNPNTLAYICLHAAIGLIQLVISKKHKLSDVVLLAVLLFFGFVTLSRTYLLCVAILAVLLFLYVPMERAQKKKIAIVCGVAAVAFVALMFAIVPELMMSFLRRIFSKGPGDSRFDLFIQYTAHIFGSFKNLLYGTGIHNMHKELMQLYGVDVPHNGIQELLVAWGLPGLVMFLAHMAAMWMRSGYDVPRPRFVHYLPLIMVLIKVQVGQLVSSHMTLLMLCMCYLSMGYDFEGRKKALPDDPGLDLKATMDYYRPIVHKVLRRK